MDDAQLLHYSRHILLEGFDLSGQERLLSSRMLLVGAGGLGSAAALYLAAAGVGHLTIADADVVEASNLQRQIIHRYTMLGSNKAVSAVSAARAINPWIELVALPERLAAERLTALASEHDVIIDASDNFTTRHDINRACVQLRKPLVSGAAIRYTGQLATFDLRDPDSPCYHCLFADTGAGDDTRCSETGVFGPLVGIIGAAQAAEAIKLVTGIGHPLCGRLLQLEIRDMQWRESQFSRDPHCPVCRQHAAG